MDAIVVGFKTNRHPDKLEGQMMLAAAASLALSTPAGDVLRNLGFGGATLTYTITPMDKPGDYNWRLTVEPSANTVH
jgi:hypothetical protein